MASASAGKDQGLHWWSHVGAGHHHPLLPIDLLVLEWVRTAIPPSSVRACKMFCPEGLPAPRWEMIPEDSWTAGVAVKGHGRTNLAPPRVRPPVHWLQRTSPKHQLDRACTFQSLVSCSVCLGSFKTASFGQGSLPCF